MCCWMVKIGPSVIIFYELLCCLFYWYVYYETISKKTWHFSKIKVYFYIFNSNIPWFCFLTIFDMQIIFVYPWILNLANIYSGILLDSMEMPLIKKCITDTALIWLSVVNHVTEKIFFQFSWRGYQWLCLYLYLYILSLLKK